MQENGFSKETTEFALLTTVEKHIMVCICLQIGYDGNMVRFLKKNLRRWGQSKNNKWAYVSFINISHFNEKLHRCDCLEMNEFQSKCQ